MAWGEAHQPKEQRVEPTTGVFDPRAGKPTNQGAPLSDLEVFIAECKAYADSDNKQAALLEVFAAFTADPGRADQIRADAATSRSLGEGWTEIAEAAAAGPAPA